MATSSERVAEYQLQCVSHSSGGGRSCAGLLRGWVGSHHTGRGRVDGVVGEEER